jgi:hypothetical protein
LLSAPTVRPLRPGLGWVSVGSEWLRRHSDKRLRSGRECSSVAVT